MSTMTNETYFDVNTRMVSRELFGTPSNILANNKEFQKAATECVLLRVTLDLFVQKLAQNYYEAEELKSIKPELAHLTKKIAAVKNKLVKHIQQDSQNENNPYAVQLKESMRRLNIINQQLNNIQQQIIANQKALAEAVKKYGEVINDMQAVLYKHGNYTNVNYLISDMERFEEDNKFNLKQQLANVMDTEANVEDNNNAYELAPEAEITDAGVDKEEAQSEEAELWQIHDDEEQKAYKSTYDFDVTEPELVKPKDRFEEIMALYKQMLARPQLNLNTYSVLNEVVKNHSLGELLTLRIEQIMLELAQLKLSTRIDNNKNIFSSLCLEEQEIRNKPGMRKYSESVKSVAPTPRPEYGRSKPRVEEDERNSYAPVGRKR